MTQTQLSEYYIRLFKGAPLSCLVALLISDAPISLSRLKTITGYNTGEILPAMELLTNHGIVSKLPGSTWGFTSQYDNCTPRSPIIGIN